MANEITLTISLRFAKGSLDEKAETIGLKVSVTGTKYIRLPQNIGTTKEALQLGDVVTAGYLWVRNLDGTNFVTLFPDGTAAGMVKLKAGEAALFRMATNTPQAQANTAAVDIEYMLVED